MERNTTNMRKTNATIEAWEVVHNYEDDIVVRGKIYGDTEGRFRDGEDIITSNVQILDLVHKVVITKNSIYKLGTGTRKYVG